MCQNFFNNPDMLPNHMPKTAHLPLPALLALRMHTGLLCDEDLLEAYHLGLLPDDQAEEVFFRIADEPDFKSLSADVARDRDMWLGEAASTSVARVLSWMTRHAILMRMTPGEPQQRKDEPATSLIAAFGAELRAFWDALVAPRTQLEFAGPASLAVPLEAGRQLEFQLNAGSLAVCWRLGLEPHLGALLDQPFQVRLGAAVSEAATARLEGEMVVVRAAFPVGALADSPLESVVLADIELLPLTCPAL